MSRSETARSHGKDMFDLSETSRLFSEVIEIFYKPNSKTIKHLKESMEENPYNFRLSNDFFKI